MTNPNKRKGTDWETAIVRFFRQVELPARRTGSAEVGSGDVHVADDWTIEAKNEARWDLAGYLRQLYAAVARSGRDRAKSAVWVKRRGRPVGEAYVLMSGDAYRALVRYVVSLERDYVRLYEAADNRGASPLRGGRSEAA